MDSSSNDIWINVWSDVFCDLRLWNGRHLLTADVRNDGRSRLIALHSYRPNTTQSASTAQTLTKALRVFHGTELETELIVRSDATAIADVGHGVLAVAGGSAVYFFKEMKPYYRFELKQYQRADQPTQPEAEIWASLKQGQTDVEGASLPLKRLQEENLIHCGVSEEFLLCKTLHERRAMLETSLPLFNAKTLKFSVQDVITCIAVLKRDATSQSHLIIGTELGVVLWLDETGTQEERRYEITGPVQFLSSAPPDCIICCSRHGLIQSVSGLAPSVKDLVQLEGPCSAMVVVGMKILAACVPSEIHCFDLNGSREYGLQMEQPIKALTPMYIPSASAQCLLVSLQNGDMLIYHEQNRLYSFSMASPVAAVTFGRYGTEDCVLATVLKDGTLDVKVLKRNFSLEGLKGSDNSAGDPLKEISQDQGVLDVDGSCDLHVAFQRHLQQLRLETIKAYTKLSVDGEGMFAENRDLQLQLRAEVLGLGPKFKIRLELSNEREGPALRNLALCLSADAAIYRLRRKYYRLPWLIPGQLYCLTAEVNATEEASEATGEVKALILRDGVSCPLMTACIQTQSHSFSE